MENEEMAHSERHRPYSLTPISNLVLSDHLINAGNTAISIPSFWKNVKNVHTSQKGQQKTKTQLHQCFPEGTQNLLGFI